MTTQSARPVSFTIWFRDNPGHAVRALPVSFALFSVALIVGFLFPGSRVSAAFVNASLVGCAAGLVHMGFRYVKTVYSALSPKRDSAEPRGLALSDIMVAMVIMPVILFPAVWVLSSLTAL